MLMSSSFILCLLIPISVMVIVAVVSFTTVIIGVVATILLTLRRMLLQAFLCPGLAADVLPHLQRRLGT